MHIQKGLAGTMGNTPRPWGRSYLRVTESRSKSLGLAKVSIINSLALVGLVSEYSRRFRSCKENSRMHIKSILLLFQADCP